MKNIIYGINTVFENIKNTNRVKEVYLIKENSKIQKLCNDKKIKVFIKPKQFFFKFDKGHQGIAAKVNSFNYSDFKLINKLEKNKPILILDQIQDPHNFGAIIRTAVAANFGAIIITKTNQVEVNSTVEKVAVGMSCHIPIIKVANINNAIIKLKKIGYWLVGTGLDNSQDYREIDYTGKIGLVIGSEGQGIRKLVLENCDYVAKLPMSKKAESLNVSVATGIMCYHIYNVKNPV